MTCPHTEASGELLAGISFSLPLVVVAIAAILAMYFWKRQQYLVHRHRIAYELIHSAVLLREELWNARAFLMTGGEDDEFRLYHKWISIEEWESMGDDQRARYDGDLRLMY